MSLARRCWLHVPGDVILEGGADSDAALLGELRGARLGRGIAPRARGLELLARRGARLGEADARRPCRACAGSVRAIRRSANKRNRARPVSVIWMRKPGKMTSRMLSRLPAGAGFRALTVCSVIRAHRYSSWPRSSLRPSGTRPSGFASGRYRRALPLGAIAYVCPVVSTFFM